MMNACFYSHGSWIILYHLTTGEARDSVARVCYKILHAYVTAPIKTLDMKAQMNFPKLEILRVVTH